MSVRAGERGGGENEKFYRTHDGVRRRNDHDWDDHCRSDILDQAPGTVTRCVPLISSLSASAVPAGSSPRTTIDTKRPTKSRDTHAKRDGSPTRRWIPVGGARCRRRLVCCSRVWPSAGSSVGELLHRLFAHLPELRSWSETALASTSSKCSANQSTMRRQ